MCGWKAFGIPATGGAVGKAPTLGSKPRSGCGNPMVGVGIMWADGLNRTAAPPVAAVFDAVP